MKKVVLGIIFPIMLSSYVSAQGFYFDIGLNSGYVDKDFSLNYLDPGLKAGYGPFGDIPVYAVGELGYLFGAGIIYYPVRLFQMGASLGFSWLNPEYPGFGWNVAMAIDLGIKNHGFLLGARYFGTVNESKLDPQNS